MDELLIEVLHPDGERPLTMNKLLGIAKALSRRAGFVIPEKTRVWRKAAALACVADGMPVDVRMLTPVEIDVVPLHRDRRWMTDTGAQLPSAKAVIDGLVDAGVLPDDGPDEVETLRFWGVQIVGYNGLRIRVRPLKSLGDRP